MPSLGADMTEGPVLEWLVQPGDAVHRGDLVAVVKTDKADIEVEIFDDGVIGELLVPVGDEMLAIGTPLATIVRRRRCPRRHAGAAPSRATADVRAAAPPPPPRPRRAAASAPPPPPAPAPMPRRGRDRVAASPYARRRAAELGVDLAQRRPGAARPSDHAPPTSNARPRPGAPAHRAPTPVDQAERDAPRDRQPHGALEARDPALLPRGRHRAHARAGVARRTTTSSVPVAERILPAALLYKAVALAARDMPALNGFWVDDAFVPGDGVHLGVAISLRGGGLVAPAIHDADQLLARRADGAPARPHRPRARRPAARVGDDRRDASPSRTSATRACAPSSA